MTCSSPWQIHDHAGNACEALVKTKKMRLLAFLPLLLGALSSLVLATDNGKTTDVTWDKYSLSVKGERLFVFSGEFHYMRLPVPELWLDVFQKLRANGFNAVSREYTSSPPKLMSRC